MTLSEKLIRIILKGFPFTVLNVQFFPPLADTSIVLTGVVCN